MPQLIIENFRHGLDKRRSILTSVLGTLDRLENAHINQGAEIEKRKAFVPVSITPTGPSGVSNILGVEPLANTIVLFGGEANGDPGNWPPTGYTYQRLYRPASVVCTSWVERKATSVIHSTVFNGKTFVIAGLEDGTTAIFYDAVLVTDINHYGQILTGMTTVGHMHCMWKQMVDATGKYTAVVTGSGIEITGLTGRRFSVTVAHTGLCSTPVAAFVSAPTSQVGGKQAFGGFQIIDGVESAGVNKITQVTVGAANLFVSAVDYTKDPEATAKAIVAEINANPADLYEGVNKGNTVVIYNKAVGDTDNTKVVQITTAGKVIIGKCAMAFFGDGFVLDFIRVNGANVLSSTLTYPTPSTETMSGFVIRVQDNINAGVGTHGIISLARDNVLKLSRQVTSSPADKAGATSVDVRVTPASGKRGYVIEAGTLQLRAYLDVSEAVFTGSLSNEFGGAREVRIRANTLNPIRAVVDGGSPPYTYRWKIGGRFSGGGAIQISPVDAGAASTHFVGTFSSTATPGVNRVNTTYQIPLDYITIYLEVADSIGSLVETPPIPVILKAIP